MSAEDPIATSSIEAPAPRQHMTEEEQVLFARYHTAFEFAVHWPDVEHFRRAVAAYDELVATTKGTNDGSHTDG